MKKIGLVGGIGPASTVEYYLGLIEKCRKEQGEDTYPEIVIDSVNMVKHDATLKECNYDSLCDYLLLSISNLKAAGAEIAAITANSEHIIWDMACGHFQLPVISIVDATVKEIKRMEYKRVLVFGTTFTLYSGLYKNALESNGITAIIPSNRDISIIGDLIYPNLENGIVIPGDKRKLITLAEKYIAEEKADAMILGCTELPLAIRQEDIGIPILNTTEIHINEIYRKATEKFNPHRK